MKGLAVSVGAQMLPQFKALAESTRDVAEWFAELSPEMRTAVTLSLETAAAVSALSLAIQGVSALAGPYIGILNSIAGAYDALKISALGAAKAAALVTGGALAIGAAVGGATAGVYAYANDISVDEMIRRYTGKNESNTNSSDDWDSVSADFDPSAMLNDAVKGRVDTTPGTLNFGGDGGKSSSGGGKGSGGGGAAKDTSVQDAREYLALFDDATKKAEDFKSTWDSIKGDKDNSLFGNVDEQVSKVEQAYLDAQSARLKAEQDGNTKSAELLAQTEAERLELLRKTEAEANAIKSDALYQYKDAAQKNNDEMAKNEEEHQALLLAIVQGRLVAED